MTGTLLADLLVLPALSLRSLGTSKLPVYPTEESTLRSGALSVERG